MTPAELDALARRIDWGHEHECERCGAAIECADRECLSGGWHAKYTPESYAKYDHLLDNYEVLKERHWLCAEHRKRRL